MLRLRAMRVPPENYQQNANTRSWLARGERRLTALAG